MRHRKARLRLFRSAAFLWTLIAPAHGVQAEESVATDLRTRLGLESVERAEFLAEMWQMLASIQGIVAGIAAAARLSGNRMAHAQPPPVRDKLPSEFKEIGEPTHLLFEEIVIRAETDDMASLAELTGRTRVNCMACHAKFRAD